MWTEKDTCMINCLKDKGLMDGNSNASMCLVQQSNKKISFFKLKAHYYSYLGSLELLNVKGNQVNMTFIYLHLYIKQTQSR